MRKIILSIIIISLIPLCSKAALISDTIHVTHYDIHLNVGTAIANQIGGYTELGIVAKMNNVTNISLNLLALTVDSVFVGNTFNTFYYNGNIISIPLANILSTTDTTNVKVYYHGAPVVESSGWGGFHMSASLSYNLGIAFTPDPHNYGRCWIPSVDDFIDRSTYDYYITCPNTQMAVCGGILLNTLDNVDGSKTFHWYFNKTIPAYLASVAVSDYVPVSGTYTGINNSIPTYIYVHPSDTNNAKASFANLNGVLTAFEHYWGPFMWQRVGYVSTPIGAMEHATNIAYPSASIDGTLNSEYLYAHELSHHWFGDLITCSTAEDMWINEGWATYNEALYKENLYGKEAYKDYLRAKLKDVLQLCHIKDNGYRAVYGIPYNYTYGETVYQKGSTIVQTLRGYLGDSLFFPAIKQMLNQYAYNNISTSQMRDFLTSYTGVNMNDFFNFYLYNPGFTHFSIDSVVPNGLIEGAKVYVRQKLKAAPAYANSNIVEITLMDNAWNTYTDTIHFSGEYGSKIFSQPFAATVAMVDMNEKLADATTDKYITVKDTGMYDYPECFFKLNVKAITDSAFVRIVHNWVTPDPFKVPMPDIKRISPDRYWSVQGIFPSGSNIKGRFYYDCYTNDYLDYPFMPSHQTADSLVLLYRSGAADDWHFVNFIKNGDMFSGYLETSNLKQGEYVLGVGKPFQSGLNNLKKQKLLNVYPNPSNDFFNISINADADVELKVYDASGAMLDSMAIAKGKKQITWHPHTNMSGGNYYIQITDKNNKVIANEKLIYTIK